jgi:hypothetical protein
MLLVFVLLALVGASLVEKAEAIPIVFLSEENEALRQIAYEALDQAKSLSMSDILRLSEIILGKHNQNLAELFVEILVKNQRLTGDIHDAMSSRLILKQVIILFNDSSNQLNGIQLMASLYAIHMNSKPDGLTDLHKFGLYKITQLISISTNGTGMRAILREGLRFFETKVNSQFKEVKVSRKEIIEQSIMSLTWSEFIGGKEILDVSFILTIIFSPGGFKNIPEMEMFYDFVARSLEILVDDNDYAKVLLDLIQVRANAKLHREIRPSN